MIPQRGYHTIFERQMEIEGDGLATVTYIEGGYNCGHRYTVVVCKTPLGVKTGWEEGFTLPVPERELPDRLHRKVRYLQPKPLLTPEEIGFEKRDNVFYHPDGWYTRSILLREVKALPFVGDGASAYDLREGVYITLPDGAYRLIPRALYWALEEVKIEGRSGDLLVINPPNWWENEERVSPWVTDSLERGEIRVCYLPEDYQASVPKGAEEIVFEKFFDTRGRAHACFECATIPSGVEYVAQTPGNDPVKGFGESLIIGVPGSPKPFGCGEPNG